MTKTTRSIGFGVLVLGVFPALLLVAQKADTTITITGGERPAIAVPTLRGSGEAQRFMDDFNQTLFADLQNSGLFKMVGKSMYPTNIPQRPQDFLAPLPPTAQAVGRPDLGLRTNDWSGPPVNAKYLAFGYTGVQGSQLVLFGWLFDVTKPDASNAQVIGKIYLGTLNAAGARQVAHDFAADILGQFGGVSLAGTKIYFVSDRSGPGTKEIWSMDFDGANQKQITFYKSISTMPGVSPDGSKIAFTSYYRGNPGIVIHSLETGRRLPFINQDASMNATADFTPDSKRILYSSTASGGYAQLYISGVDGGNLQRLSHVRHIEVEPKVNPKTGNELVFVSDRSGLPQIYKMNMEGTDVTRLTNGEGEAVNPAWNPSGTHIAFAWTKGFAPGKYNIFVMDIASRQITQLTQGAGRNENPVWAPDGTHLAFSSDRSGRVQIYTMLVDGTQVQRLTNQGRNQNPVWSKK